MRWSFSNWWRTYAAQAPAEPHLPVWSDAVIGTALHRLWPQLSERIHLADRDFQPVTVDEIRRADRKAYAPHKPEVWDCDDQASAVVHHLKVARSIDRRSRGAPASGTLWGTHINGNHHAWVWWVEPDQTVHLWDATHQRKVPTTEIQTAFRALDR